MIQNFRRAALVALLLGTQVVPAAAAPNKEHQQLMADLRMLQEQSQILLNLLGSVSETLKVVNVRIDKVDARLDEQANATRRAIADQKLVIDTLANDVRVIREKLDDNNVRVGSLTQEIDALRQSMQQGGGRPALAPTASSVAAGLPTSASPPPITLSPQKLWDGAYADYTAGQWDLAIQGFDMYIKSFPRSDMADNAQVNIGNAYLNDGKPEKAVEAYDKAIRTYPGADSIPEAYFKKGLALQNLKDLNGARDAWEYAVRSFPESDGGRLAKQRLEQLRRP